MNSDDKFKPDLRFWVSVLFIFLLGVGLGQTIYWIVLLISKIGGLI